jgi:hypothetical protein
VGDLGVCGKKECKRDLQGVGWGGMGWIDLTQDWDRWRAPVNAVVSLRVPKNARNFFD